jgi:hypothetical protein
MQENNNETDLEGYGRDIKCTGTKQFSSGQIISQKRVEDGSRYGSLLLRADRALLPRCAEPLFGDVNDLEAGG